MVVYCIAAVNSSEAEPTPPFPPAVPSNNLYPSTYSHRLILFVTVKRRKRVNILVSGEGWMNVWRTTHAAPFPFPFATPFPLAKGFLLLVDGFLYVWM